MKGGENSLSDFSRLFLVRHMTGTMDELRPGKRLYLRQQLTDFGRVDAVFFTPQDQCLDA